MIARRTGLFRNSDRTVPWTGALDRAVKYEKYYHIIFYTDAPDKVVKYGVRWKVIVIEKILIITVVMLATALVVILKVMIVK